MDNDPAIPAGAAGVRVGCSSQGKVVACWIGSEQGSQLWGMAIDGIRLQVQWPCGLESTTEARLVPQW